MRKKRKSRWYAALVFMVMGILLLMPQTEAQAASAKSKAVKAYKAFLAQKTIPWGTDRYYTAVPTSKCSFALAYINKDSVPELVVKSGWVTHAAGYGVVFTYKNGSVQPVANIHLDGSFYYYKKKSVCVSSYVGFGVLSNSYYKMSGTKLFWRFMEDKEITTGKKSYYKGTSSRTQNTSKSKFNAALKKMVGSTKKTKAKFYKNTAKNRRKYLK